MSQKALILLEAHGKFVLGTRRIPKPGPDELLVKIQATAINHVDWKNQSYGLFISEYPAILGIDSAGIVEQVGENVTGFSKGDEVFHQGDFKNDYATFQQYTLVPAEMAVKKPSNISFEEAASIPHCLATAAQGLYGDRKRPDIFRLVPPWEYGGELAAEGKTIVVLGAASSVGQYAVQLAKLSGFSTIIATGRRYNSYHFKSLGVSTFVDRKASNFQEELIKAINGAKVDVVFDAVSLDDTQSLGWDILAPGGALILTQAPTIDREKYPDKKVVDDICGNVYNPHLRHLAVSMYKALPGLLESGKLKPIQPEFMSNGLIGIVHGLARLQANRCDSDKLIGCPQESTPIEATLVLERKQKKTFCLQQKLSCKLGKYS